MFIPVDVDLKEHPKTIQFANLLRVCPREAQGVLICLWQWTLKYWEDGSIGPAIDDLTLSNAVAWTPLSGSSSRARAELLVTSLIAAGWANRELDGSLKLHAWQNHAGKLVKSQEKAAEKMRRYRERKSEDVMVTLPLRDGYVTEDIEEKGTEGNRDTRAREADSVRVFSLPEWFPKPLWDLFLSHRKAVKAPLTAKSYHTFLEKFTKLRAEGWEPQQVVDMMVEKGWRWFKPEWVKENDGHKQPLIFIPSEEYQKQKSSEIDKKRKEMKSDG